jgi:hypothetical protein
MSAITPLGDKFPSYYVDDRLDHFDIDVAWHWLSNYAYWVRTKVLAGIIPATDSISLSGTPSHSRHIRNVSELCYVYLFRTKCLTHSSHNCRQIEKAFKVFGLFHRSPEDSSNSSGKMVGMARVVGDGDTNYLSDVFIFKEHQGGGLGVIFLKVVLDAEGRDAWRWLLHTYDRRDWYMNKFDFVLIGDACRGEVLGHPVYILERDGMVIKARQAGTTK